MQALIAQLLNEQIAEVLRLEPQQLDLDEPLKLEPVRGWLDTHQIRILNVAGPRESNFPGVSGRTREFLRKLMEK